MNSHNIFIMAASLSSMQRYSQTFMNKKESVLEHTGFVVLFCCLIAQELISRGKKVDVALLLNKAALHDVDEIITGDIPRPTKYFDDETRKTFEKIENHGMMKLISDMSLPTSTFDLWSNSKKGLEGSIVAIADVAAVAYKVWEEKDLLGNKGFSDHEKNVVDHLCKMLLSLQDDDLKEIIIDILKFMRK